MTISKPLIELLVKSTDLFPVDFDNAWGWLEYSRKDHAKTCFDKAGFIEDVDFSRNLGKSLGGRPAEQIYLTVDCFKMFCMMAGTAKGQKIRLYFLECERRLREIESAAPLIEWQSQINELNQRITEIEIEQQRYQSSCGRKYSVLAYAIILELEVSLKVASALGRHASKLCSDRDIKIEKIYDPRFGLINIYPQSLLAEVFENFDALVIAESRNELPGSTSKIKRGKRRSCKSAKLEKPVSEPLQNQIASFMRSHPPGTWVSSQAIKDYLNTESVYTILSRMVKRETLLVKTQQSKGRPPASIYCLNESQS